MESRYFVAIMFHSLKLRFDSIFLVPNTAELQSRVQIKPVSNNRSSNPITWQRSPRITEDSAIASNRSGRQEHTKMAIRARHACAVAPLSTPNVLQRCTKNTSRGHRSGRAAAAGQGSRRDALFGGLAARGAAGPTDEGAGDRACSGVGAVVCREAGAAPTDRQGSIGDRVRRRAASARRPLPTLE